MSRDSEDELDRLFNYNAHGTDAADPPSTSRPNGQFNAATEAIDEEVKVARKRRVVAKLDAQRLECPAGVPKLRKMVKSLRFGGKGHEFSDMTRLINTYQLWLDELYPKAKFTDGLNMIEALGHKKPMQRIRRDWMDERRVNTMRVEMDTDRAGDDTEGDGPVMHAKADDAPLSRGTEEQGPRVETQTDHEPPDMPEDDELDALLAEDEPEPIEQSTQVRHVADAGISSVGEIDQEEEEIMAGCTGDYRLRSQGPRDQ